MIFAKVMERGDFDHCRWLLGAYPPQALGDWFERHGERHLSPRSLSFWSVLLKQPVPQRRPQIPRAG